MFFRNLKQNNKVVLMNSVVDSIGFIQHDFKGQVLFHIFISFDEKGVQCLIATTASQVFMRHTVWAKLYYTYRLYSSQKLPSFSLPCDIF